MLTFVDERADEEAVGDDTDRVDEQINEDNGRVAVDKDCFLVAHFDGNEERVDGARHSQVDEILNKPRCPVGRRRETHQLHRFLKRPIR